MECKVKKIRDIDTALRIYYQNTELNNADMKELFPGLGTTRLQTYKKAVQAAQAEQGIASAQIYSINTKIAYEVWGIDVVDLETRKKKLKELGLGA